MRATHRRWHIFSHMNNEVLIAAITGGLILLYLSYTIVRPEKF